MFDTDEEQEMLYTLSVNLDYFAQETERGSRNSKGDKAKNYKVITNLLKMSSALVKENLSFRKNEIKDFANGYYKGFFDGKEEANRR